MKEIFKKQLSDSIDSLCKTVGSKDVYLFGHCEATMDAVCELRKRGIEPCGILDNNSSKIGQCVSGINIINPIEIKKDDSLICIAARAYTAMVEQLRTLGYKGDIIKLIDYDPYSAPSLDFEVVEEKTARLQRGIIKWNELVEKYPDYFVLICPYGSLGDVIHAVEYYSFFAKKRSNAKIVKMYGYSQAEVYSWMDMTEVVQAALYLNPKNAFIAHNDKPYTIYIPNALQFKFITHEKMYCCGVYGLDINTMPNSPSVFSVANYLEEIPNGKAVIIAPYADSVTKIDVEIWKQIIDVYTSKGYKVYTNVIGDEQPVEGTEAISPSVDEYYSVVERAGTFIGLRSGLCDLLRFAKCRKIALYPKQFYSDTKWTIDEIFAIDTFENIIVDEDFKWELN